MTSKLTTFISSEKELHDYVKAGATHLIIDNTPYSNRSLKPESTLQNTISLFKTCQTKYPDIKLSLNCDVILHNHMIDDIISLFKLLNDINCHHIRFQDLGILTLIKDYCPKATPCYISETGSNNIESLKQLVELGVECIQFTNELPFNHIQQFENELNIETQLQVHGHILIQHSHRQLLSGINKAAFTFHQTEDHNFKGRFYHFYEGQHGTFMFGHFDRCLLEEISRLKKCNITDWIIDFRGLNNDIISQCITTYQKTAKTDLNKTNLTQYKLNLEILTKRPSKAGFFISNKTDIDWRDEKKQPLKNKQVVAQFLDTEKPNYLVMEAIHKFEVTDNLYLLTPENKELHYNTISISNLTDSNLTVCQSGEMIKLPWIKGIMPGTKLIQPI